jgi:NADH-quinone oxidoreductase subunit L
MLDVLPFFVLWPLVGFGLSLLLADGSERGHARWALATLLVQGILLLLFIGTWWIQGGQEINLKEWTLYQTDDYAFYLDFYFDRVTAIFGALGAGLALLVVSFSRIYLHREAGYKRFFNTVLFFFLSYNTAVFAGNLETLFLGWEGLGISSFLLIAYYRNRYLPVKNALKVFSIYRIGDVGLLLAMWMSHHFWHENISFAKLLQKELVHEHLVEHTGLGVALSLCLLLAAMAKSAQWPFTSWLPRAMEGPTPSSAIFYGSLSVHMGAFLLLRTHPFWENQATVAALIGTVGVLTTLISTAIARVQSSIKAQIAYASAAQIGLIFVEIALGWDLLALFHTVGNASLRTYQLLVSPSVVTVLIRKQMTTRQPTFRVRSRFIPDRWRATFFWWSLNEFHLDHFQYTYLWHPLKKLGRALFFVRLESALVLFFGLVLGGVVGVVRPDLFPDAGHDLFPTAYMVFALLFVLRSFSERLRVDLAWGLLAMSHTLVSLAIGLTGKLNWTEAGLYLGGIYGAFLLGLGVFHTLKKQERLGPLHTFNGLVEHRPFLAGLGLLATLGISGFPITSAFLGEDLLFAHIESHDFLLATLMATVFVVDGLAAMRIFARIFLGTRAQSPLSELLKNA